MRLIKEKNLIIPTHLIYNKKMIDKFARVEVNHYCEYINELLINNYNFACIVEEERFKYVNEKLNLIDNNIFDEYKDYKNFDSFNIFEKFHYKDAFKLQKLYQEKDDEMIKQELEKITEREMFELIIGTFFKELPHNFLINLKTILEYKKENSNYKPKNLELYLKLINFNSLNTKEKQELFNKYKNEDLATQFYDDYLLARNLSYDSINDNLLKLNKDSKIYNKELSERENLDIYYLDGEEFYLCIHSSRYLGWMDNKKTISLSLISHNNITYFNEMTAEIVYGFNGLIKENIMHVSNVDSYTSHEYGTDKIQRIYSPSRLIDETKSYNEILYSEKNLEDFKPDFIVAFDKITDDERETAREMNLPIVLINSKKYLKKQGLENIRKNRYLNAQEAKDINEYEIFNERIK